MFFSISLPAIAPPAPRSVTAASPPPTAWSPAPGPPAAAPAPPASSRTSTVRTDSTVPHKAQLLGGTGVRPGSAGRASPCVGENPLCNQPVTAPAPMRPAISTQTARPVNPEKRGSIRICPDWSALASANLFLPPLESRRNRWHESNPRANICLRTNSMGYLESRMPKIFDTSLVNDSFPRASKIELMGKGICCRPGATTRRIPRARIGRVSALFGLEHLRLELVALEQLVEFGAIALRELRGPGHAATRDAQDPNQVFALEGSARLLERRKLRGLLPQCLLDERGRHDARRAE